MMPEKIDVATLAQKSGMHVDKYGLLIGEVAVEEEITIFARLVMEECAKWCRDAAQDYTEHGNANMAGAAKYCAGEIESRMP